MSEIGSLINTLRKDLCRGFEFQTLENNFIKISTPFTFDDGDNITLGLKLDLDDKKWRLTDASDSYLHLTYHFGSFDFFRGKRKELFYNFLKMYNIEEKNGELFKIFNSKDFSIALYEFIQCVQKVSSLTILDREIVETTFRNDLKLSLNSFFKKRALKPEINYQFDYFFEEDKAHAYKIDCYIRSIKIPILIFAIGSRYSCQNATISILMLEKTIEKFYSVAFFKEQSNITPKVVNQLTDASDKTISNLNQFERFEKYYDKLV